MAAVASPYGLRPVNLLGGQVNTGSERRYNIANSYATSIYYGDVVTLTTGGTIVKFAGTTGVGAQLPPLGVFMGVEYVDPASRQLWHRNRWIGGTTVPTGTNVWAYVLDDPDALFEIQADEAVGQNGIGTNAALVQGSGNATTGMSAVALDGDSIADTATLPLRIVDYVDKQGFSALGDTYTDMIVRFNLHFHRSTTGNAAS